MWQYDDFLNMMTTRTDSEALMKHSRLPRGRHVSQGKYQPCCLPAKAVAASSVRLQKRDHDVRRPSHLDTVALLKIPLG